jgi:rRNA maturation endonuclease Nob1
MKLLVCEKCEGEFKLKHTMDEGYYNVSFCPFCGEDLNEELEDIVEWEDDD